MNSAYNPYDVECPKCGAKPRKGCVGKRWKTHGERNHLAKKKAGK